MGLVNINVWKNNVHLDMFYSLRTVNLVPNMERITLLGKGALMSKYILKY